MSRLDRFLISPKLDAHFSNGSQIKLFNPISDNFLVLLDTDETDWGPKPFRFSNAWVDDPKFVDLIMEWERDFLFMDGRLLYYQGNSFS